MNNRGLVLATMALSLACSAQAEPLNGHPPAMEKSGGTYHKPVCPKPGGGQVMRCHALVVTDSKGNPVESPSPPAPRQLPNGKQPDR